MPSAARACWARLARWRPTWPRRSASPPASTTGRRTARSPPRDPRPPRATSPPTRSIPPPRSPPAPSPAAPRQRRWRRCSRSAPTRWHGRAPGWSAGAARSRTPSRRSSNSHARPRLFRVPAAVTQLAIAPVKGLQVTAVDELEIGPAGPVGDRAFLVVDPENTLLLTTRTPRLLQVSARWEDGVLALAFPDGRTVAAAPEPGERA